VKGIVLAGGYGRRLGALTRITNKHLLPVYDKPMVYYPIEQLVGAGIEEIMIVTGGNHAGEFLRLLGNGSEFGLRALDYAYQERAGGIAEALGLAEHFADGDAVAVALGDNIFERSLAPIVDRYLQHARGAKVVLAEVDDPGSYGVAEMRDGRLVRILEKPPQPPSRLVVSGFYLYDARVFDEIRRLRPSGRGELEITDVNNEYLSRGELAHELVTGYWADCGGSVDTLLRANTLVASRGANKKDAS